MVQLIGNVESKPKEYEIEENTVVRFIIRIRNRDDKFDPFYTEHVVIVPKDVADRCNRAGIEIYDAVLVKGRLFNHKDKETGKILTNVQAHEVLSLKKYKKPVIAQQSPRKTNEAEVIGKTMKMLDDPRYQEGKKSGKIVSLMNERAKRELDDDYEEEKYEDEDLDEIPF